MIRIFKTEDGVMHEKSDMQPGCWIALTNPTASEVMDVADACQIDPDHIKAPLDEEERSRIEVEDNYTPVFVELSCTTDLTAGHMHPVEILDRHMMKHGNNVVVQLHI